MKANPAKLKRDLLLSVLIFIALCTALFFAHRLWGYEYAQIPSREFLYLSYLNYGLFFALITAEFLTGVYKPWTRNELILDFFSFVLPIALAVGFDAIWPSLHGPYQRSLVQTPPIIGTLLFLLILDLVLYWEHRFTHTFKTLWPFHRAHHRTKSIGVLLYGRESFWLMAFTVLVPFRLFIFAAFYLGLYKSAVFSANILLLIQYLTHMNYRWDEPLYRNRWTSKAMSVVETIFILPVTHHIHHGVKNSVVGVNVNLGVGLVIWDRLFKTAEITRVPPRKFGLVEDASPDWKENLFYPARVSVRERGSSEREQK